MNNQTRWIASWKDLSGRDRVYILRSSPSRLYARVDFQLRLLDQGEFVPRRYEFEKVEGEMLVPGSIGRKALPTMRESKWSSLRPFHLIQTSPLVGVKFSS